MKRHVRRLTSLGRIEDIRKLALADPSGVPDRRDTRRNDIAVFQCLDHCVCPLDLSDQAAGALDDQKFVASQGESHRRASKDAI